MGQNHCCRVGSSSGRSLLAPQPPCSSRQSAGVGGQARSGKSLPMQMSKFSLSSHPCGMQDESCPNGAHSYYFGGLCRCVPGHPRRENHTQPRLLVPWQLVRRWRKGDSTFRRVGSLLPEPDPFTRGRGMLEGGPGAASAGGSSAGRKLCSGCR